MDNIWPHEIRATQGISDELDRASNQRSKVNLGLDEIQPEGLGPQSNEMVHLWAQAGLLTESGPLTMGLTGKPNPNQTQHTIIQTHFNSSSPSPTVGNDQIPNLLPEETIILSQSSLTINEGGTQPQTARRRGRPPGATNKIPQSAKGKSPIVHESCEIGGKKRKLMGTTDQPPYIPDPPMLELDLNNINHNFPITEGPSSFSMNFIQQLLHHPQSAALLAQDGIIHPDILTLINQQPDMHKSPTSIFQGPYSAATEDDINEEDIAANITAMTYTDLSGRLVTVDESGGIEYRAEHLIELGSKNPSDSPLMYSSSSEVHIKEQNVDLQNLQKLLNVKGSSQQSGEESDNN